jgi:hypothetical protein
MRCDPDLNAAMYPRALRGVLTLYAPGPGVADLRDSRSLALEAWYAARSEGDCPRADAEPEPVIASVERTD